MQRSCYNWDNKNNPNSSDFANPVLTNATDYVYTLTPMEIKSNLIQPSINNCLNISSFYIYTNIQHKNPPCRIADLETAQKKKMALRIRLRALNYDKEKYREMIFDGAEAVLGTFGFGKTVYSDSKKKNGKRWQKLIQERRRDIETEMT